MRKINGITNSSRQIMTVPLEDGSSFSLSLSYNPMVMSWFITELVYEDFVLKGYRISRSNNILHQYRNLIPFGIACYSIDEREPRLIDDFDQDYCQLFLLSKNETEKYWEFLSGQ